MNASRVLFALLVGLPACFGAGNEEDALHPEWIADDWYHDDGRDGFATYADYYITLGADGFGSYTDDHGSYDFAGAWQLDGNMLTVGDYPAMEIEWTPNCGVISAEGRTYIGTVDKARPDCPTKVDPLDDLEACLVGVWSTWSDYNGIIEEQSWTFGADRTYVEFYDSSGYTSGGGAYAVEGQWRVTESREIEILYPAGDAEVRTSLDDFPGRTHDGDLDSACDRAGFEGGGDDDGSSSGGDDSSGGDSTGDTSGAEGPENDELACTDAFDNDADGYIDCDASYPDFDCCGVGSCGCDGACAGQGACGTEGPENDESACTDAFDNDGDGYIDCDPSYPDFECCGVGSCGCDGACAGQGLCG
jgi:hypothetical protein